MLIHACPDNWPKCAGSTTWLRAPGDKHPHYKYLGRVKPGLTNQGVISEAEEVLDNMGEHKKVKNNCYTFVKEIYAKEKV